MCCASPEIGLVLALCVCEQERGRRKGGKEQRERGGKGKKEEREEREARREIKEREEVRCEGPSIYVITMNHIISLLRFVSINHK